VLEILYSYHIDIFHAKSNRYRFVIYIAVNSFGKNFMGQALSSDFSLEFFKLISYYPRIYIYSSQKTGNHVSLSILGACILLNIVYDFIISL
jgi:hypothetical protein